MNFSRARRKAAAIAVRLSAIVCHESMTQRQWALMLFIFRRFIPLVTRIARAAITRLPVNRATQACRGQLAVKRADTKRSSLPSGCWPISIGFKNRYENAEWKSRSISRSIAHPIILMSKSIRIGSTSARTARSNMRRIRRKSTKTFIR